MKICVTGSSGFIARFLIPLLGSKGYSIVGLDKTSPDINFGEYFSFVHGDIMDEEKLGKAMTGCEIVIHLAAEHKDFGVPENLYYKVNVDGSQKLLECAEKNDIRSLIFFSSVAVYGNNSEPSNERMTPHPASSYGKSKLLVEEAIQRWYSCDKARSIVIMRPALIFGPFNYANMYRLIAAIAKKKYFPVGDGRNIKSIAYVENIADATLFLMERMKPGVELFNYADSPHLESHAIASIIAETLDVKLPRIRIPTSLAMGLVYPFDLLAAVTKIDLPFTSKRVRKFTSTTYHRADKILSRGFVPRFTTQEGLEKMASWYASNVSESQVAGMLQDRP